MKILIKGCRNMGRLLHQTPHFQPNPIHPRSLARLRLGSTPEHGRTLPHPALPPSNARAYWLHPDKKILSSQVMLVQPSAGEFARVMARVAAAGDNDYDTEMVNYLYGDTALVLPHRPYDMISGEFRQPPDIKARPLSRQRGRAVGPCC
jgi:hypothetical protein